MIAHTRTLRRAYVDIRRRGADGEGWLESRNEKRQQHVKRKAEIPDIRRWYEIPINQNYHRTILRMYKELKRNYIKRNRKNESIENEVETKRNGENLRNRMKAL